MTKSLLLFVLILGFSHNLPVIAQVRPQTGAVEGVVLASEDTDDLDLQMIDIETSFGLPPEPNLPVVIVRHGEDGDGRWRQITYTNTAGHFVFHNLTPGLYDIAAATEPVVRVSNFEVKGGETRYVTLNEDLAEDLKDTAYGWLEVHIVDQTGRDLAGASLQILDVQPIQAADEECTLDAKEREDLKASPFTLRTTDTHGRVVVYVLRACRYSVRATLPSVANSEAVTVDVQRWQHVAAPMLHITVPRDLGSIHAVCVGRCSERLQLIRGEEPQNQFVLPIANGFVLGDNDPDAQTRRSTFDILHLPPGHYRLREANHKATSEPFEVVANRAVNLAVQLTTPTLSTYKLEVRPSAILIASYQRVGEARVPLEDVSITVHKAGADSGTSCSTAADGRCELIRVDPGDYLVTAALDGFETQTDPISLNALHWKDLDIVLKPIHQGTGGPIAPTLTDIRHPTNTGSIEGVVEVGSGDAPDIRWSTGKSEEALTIRDGGFRSSLNWAPGEYTLRYRSSEGEKFRSVNTEIKAGETTFVALPNELNSEIPRFGAIEVQVTDAMGRPLRDALVDHDRVYPVGRKVDSEAGISDEGPSRCWTDQNGTCLLAPVFRGAYAVYAGLSGFQDSGRRVVVVNARRLTRTRLVLSSKIAHESPVGSLHGRVTGPDPKAFLMGNVILDEDGVKRCAPIREGYFTFNWVPASETAFLTFNLVGLLPKEVRDVKVIPEKSSELPLERLSAGTNAAASLNPCPGF